MGEATTNYKKNFIILDEQAKEFRSNPTKSVAGYAKLEDRGDKIIVGLYIQNIILGEVKVYCICARGKDIKALECGKLKIGSGNKGEAAYECEAKKMFSSYYDAKDISGVSVGALSGKVILEGFMDEKVTYTILSDNPNEEITVMEKIDEKPEKDIEKIEEIKDNGAKEEISKVPGDEPKQEKSEKNGEGGEIAKGQEEITKEVKKIEEMSPSENKVEEQKVEEDKGKTDKAKDNEEKNEQNNVLNEEQEQEKMQKRDEVKEDVKEQKEMPKEIKDNEAKSEISKMSNGEPEQEKIMEEINPSEKKIEEQKTEANKEKVEEIKDNEIKSETITVPNEEPEREKTEKRDEAEENVKGQKEMPKEEKKEDKVSTEGEKMEQQQGVDKKEDNEGEKVIQSKKNDDHEIQKIWEERRINRSRKSELNTGIGEKIAYSEKLDSVFIPFENASIHFKWIKKSILNPGLSDRNKYVRKVMMLPHIYQLCTSFGHYIMGVGEQHVIVGVPGKYKDTYRYMEKYSNICEWVKISETMWDYGYWLFYLDKINGSLVYLD